MCGVGGTVKDVFAFSGFDNLFPVYETPEDALKHL